MSRTFSHPISARIFLLFAALTILQKISAATFTVTTTNLTGAGSFQQALFDANTNAGADTITFNIASGGLTVSPTNALPAIVEPVTIDGATQPGFSGIPIIELNGTSAGALVDGLKILTSNCVIRSLVINRYLGDGIEIATNGFNTVEGCYIGLNRTGVADQGNTLNGIFLTNSPNNSIGGLDATNRNYISGNNQSGLNLGGARATNNSVVGNFIGLNITNGIIANSADGIRLNAPLNTIGGGAAGSRNVISGNTGEGIEITISGTNNFVRGNYIGTDSGGTLDRGNTTDGILVSARNVTIGGAAAGEGNLISGNSSEGIQIDGTNITVLGNFIGTDYTGTNGLANASHGVLVNTASRSNIVGGITAGEGNVIAFNTADGISVAANANATNHTFRGNSIFSNGTSASHLGIDLGADGIAINDVGDSDTGANNLQNYPTLTAVTNSSTETTFSGTLNSRPSTTFAVDFYANVASDTGGNGEGRYYLGSTNLATAADSNVTFTVSLPITSLPARYITATATDPFGNTSEFGDNVFAVSTVTGVTFTVVNTNNSGPGSLRQAITDANATVNGGDTIAFAITNLSTMIPLASALPAITDPVTIDGYTQPGTATNTSSTIFNGTLLVRLSGTSAGTANGLNITIGDSTVRGLIITGFSSDGIELAGMGGNVIQGCIIGLDAAGTDQGNTANGIFISGSSNNIVGGASPGSRNVISGNNSDGVEISGVTAGGNQVLGNLIGTDLGGTIDRGNSADGIFISGAPGNTIGGLTSGARNVISGNNSEGVSITVAGASNNVVVGNFIGTDVTGTVDLGNSAAGVAISGVPNNVIGGSVAGARNIISGNNNDGVNIANVGATGNLVQGNYIGTDVTGTLNLGNADNGVILSSAPGNTIGGSLAAEGNIISGSSDDGIEITGVASSTNVIRNNFIGTDLSGTVAIANGGHGINVAANAHDNLIGGSGNTIGFNTGDGVFVASGTNNAIRHNQIFLNGGLGIDLGASGVTNNDLGDVDGGANFLQNFPIIALGIISTTNVVVTADLNSTASTSYEVDFFSSPVPDGSGNGEGAQYLGSTNVTTDGGGNVSFTADLPAMAVGRYLTATATDATGNTSEFSPAVRATSIVPSQTFIVSNTNNSGAGSLREAITQANALISGGNDVIAFAIAGAGPHTISPTNPLPDISDPVTIDGFTQSGAITNSLCASNNTVIKIRLTGNLAPGGTDGLKLASYGGCIIRGLVIVGFGGDGVEISSGTNNQVAGCFIGLDVDGSQAPGNTGMGVRVTGTTTAANFIGGASPGDRNVVAGNLNGIYLDTTSANIVAGNFIGMDAGGTLDRGNINAGVVVSGASAVDNIIGGTNGCSRNVISGNGALSYLDHYGVNIVSAQRTRIVGNFIGTDASGAQGLANSRAGLRLAGAKFTEVGGATAAERNIISANLFGVLMESAAVSNTISGNYIGTDAGGTQPLGNVSQAIVVSGASYNLIGGVGAGNLISANGDGVYVAGNSSPGNRLLGNFIGTTAGGASSLGNGSSGVRIEQSDTQVGGTNSGEGNIIAHNGGYGVSVTSGDVRCPILGNGIYSNSALGIELYAPAFPFSGVSPNDAGDVDTGGNNLQNFPELSLAIQYPAETVITGALNSQSSTTYRIEFFDNASRDISGYGQGQTYLGFTNVTTDVSGAAGFVFTNPAALPSGHYITATATDPTNSTGEFSAAKKVVAYDSVDVQVTLADSADPSPHATNIVYTLTFTNAGPADASGVTATNTLPPGVMFVSATPSQGSCTHTSGVVTCSLGTLTNGAAVTVLIEGTSSITAFLNDSVAVWSSQLDNDTNNNAATETTFFGVADVGLTITDSPDPVIAGQTVSFTVAVTNYGPDTATATTLYFTLDSNCLVTGSGVSQGLVTPFGNFFYCQFGNLPPGDGATLSVSAIPTVSGVLTHSGYAFPAEADLILGNNSTNEQTTVLDGPGIPQILTASLDVSEGDGVAMIDVTRAGGAIGTVTVDYATSNLTALAGSDFTDTVGMLTFTNGQTLATIFVPLTDDATAECVENFFITLFNPTGGALLLLNTNATITVYDNEIISAGSVSGASVTATNSSMTGNSYSLNPVISDDGGYIAFDGPADNLVLTPDANGNSDVFLRDLATGTNLLISVNLAGTNSGNGYSASPSVSATGQRVVFYSEATDIVAADNNLAGDIFLRDVTAGTTTLVSVNHFGSGPANNYSSNPRLTPDGRFVAFESAGTDVVTNDLNDAYDIFLRDLNSGVTELISVNGTGTGSANSQSYAPRVSDDGRYVGFETSATDLGPTDGNGAYDIYVRDRFTGTNILCSLNPGSNTSGNGESYNHILSADGRYVVFDSYASDLVTNDSNGGLDVFRFDLQTRTVQLVSVNQSSTGSGNDYSYRGGISRDGRYVSFYSEAGDLVTGDTNGYTDVFVRDMVTGTTTLISVNCHDGSAAAGDSYYPEISADGRYVSFESYARDLAPGNYAGVANIFRRDRLAGTTVLVSPNRFLTGSGNGYSVNSRISTNGGIIAFTSSANDLILSDANGTDDAFIWQAGAVVGFVDLVLEKSVATNQVVQTESVSYALAVTNSGTATATGVIITDTMPVGLNFVSANTSQGSTTNFGNTVTASVGSLNAGDGAVISITATAVTAGSLTNSATSVANETDAASADNTDSVAITVSPLAPPPLFVLATNAQILVSWPSSTPTAFTLEATTNLVPVVVWTPMTNGVSNNGLLKSVLITPLPGDPQRFYRLRY